MALFLENVYDEGVKRLFARGRAVIVSLVLFICLLGSKFPDLTPPEVTGLLHHMMEAHATHKQLTPQLMQRTLLCFLESLDPTHSYFLSPELAPWLSIEEPRLKIMAAQVEAGDFSPFFTLHTLLCKAIERRKQLEEELLPASAPLSTEESPSWPADAAHLSSRLAAIQALQAEATAKLDALTKEKAYARIAKRRALKEEEICHDPTHFVLCNTLKAFASALDNHTCYFTPAEAAQFMIQVQQRLVGIGVQMRDDLNGFTIVKILEGSPASLHPELKQGDRIIAIDGEPVVGLEITDAVELIRGEEGSRVTLTLLRGEGEEERLDVSLQRGEVVIQEARLSSQTFPYAEGVIAHLTLHSFYQDPTHSSSSDLYDEILRLKKTHKIKGIILDLRDNSGGILPQAVSVAGLFITKGIVVSIKDNLGVIEHLREIDGKMAYDGPLIILTSKLSASAAEIVAQTLQDYGRALVVGDEHTFGKGTFQTFSLDIQNKINPKGELKITRGRYYTVSGKSPQLVGVIPDIIVPGIFAHAKMGERHSKYPLDTDSIPENFHDDLSDIPLLQRDHVSWLYRFNLQSQLKIYTRCLPLLKDNSEERLTRDPFYQQFLTDLKKEIPEENLLKLYLDADPQLTETLNIMKDLILLLA